MRTRTLGIVAACVLVLGAVGYLRYFHGHGNHPSWEQAPNFVYYLNGMYYYGSDWADDPPASCAPNGEWHGSPPSDLQSVGFLTDLKIDETASQGFVKPTGDGSEVYLSSGLVGKQIPDAIWIKPWEGYWIEYHPHV